MLELLYYLNREFVFDHFCAWVMLRDRTMGWLILISDRILNKRLSSLTTNYGDAGRSHDGLVHPDQRSRSQ